MSRRLLVLDTSYSLEHIKANKLEASVTCRDLGGYFDKVWTVHPFATLLTSEEWTDKFGRPVETEIAANQFFIEGKIGRFEALSKMPSLNFLLSQGDTIRQLVRLVREHDISVVRAGDHLLMGLYGLAVARLCGIPLAVRINGHYGRVRKLTGKPMMPRFFRTAKLEEVVERFVLSRADLVAGSTEDYRQYAIAMGARPERTTVFRYGNLLDAAHWLEPSARDTAESDLIALGLQHRRFMICVGRLEAVKMADHPLRVLAKVRDGGLDVALVMVGNGTMLAELQQLAVELGISEHVVFAGTRDQAWLARVIPRAAVALSPLTGRALTEVAFGGTPTVAYDLDWQGELIRSGVTGELVAARDIDGMARAAAKLLSDEPCARRLGKQLRATAFDMLGPEQLDAHERAQYDLVFQRAQKPI